MRTITELRDVCSRLPGSRETFPFDATTLVFKLGAALPEHPGTTGDDAGVPERGVYKMYALTGVLDEPMKISLKCDPVRSETLRREYKGLVVPGYHLSKRHWNTLSLDGSLPDDLVLELIRHSYTLVRTSLPKLVRVSLNEL